MCDANGNNNGSGEISPKIGGILTPTQVPLTSISYAGQVALEKRFFFFF